MGKRKQAPELTEQQKRDRLIGQYSLIPAEVIEDMRLCFDGVTYVQGDSHQSAFNEGQRHVYRAILQMREEHARSGNDDDRHNDAELERSDGSELVTGAGDR